ncbi:hypothetical protein Tco_0318011 [Tanacetum coccineum]
MTNILANGMIGLSFQLKMVNKVLSKFVDHDGNAKCFELNILPMFGSEETIKLDGLELIDDVVTKSEGGFNVSSFMNGAVSKGFKGIFGIIRSRS